MMMIEENELQAYVAENPQLTLTSGKHKTPECGACIIEVCSLALGFEWTDNPLKLCLPDVRPLNDASWSTDALRTEHLLRVGIATWPYRNATDRQKQGFKERLAELTIQRVLPMMLKSLGLAREAERCEKEGTEAAARAAVHASRAVAYSADAAYARAAAAYSADAAAAAYSADAAADAASYSDAARAARAAARAADHTTDEVLIIACDCWVEAAQELTK